jgi:transposase
MRWANSGVWERVFHALVRDRKNQYLMLDSTIVRAHQQYEKSKACFRAIAALACAWLHLRLYVDTA